MKNRRPSIPSQQKNRRPTRTRLLALEPRILFDGVALVDPATVFAVDADGQAAQVQMREAAVEVPNNPAAHEAISHEGGKDATVVATPAPPEESRMQTPADGRAVSERMERQIVFYDPQLPDRDQLLAEIGRGMELIALDPSGDGIAQIQEALASGGPVAAVHILTHGSASAIALGGTSLTQSVLDTRATDIAAWGTALSADADILIYGCDVAADQGDAFLARIAGLTGADVSASADATGNARLGGDWQLEITHGNIESRTLSLDGFEHLLAAPTSANKTDAISETSVKTFSSSDFPFSDTDGQSLKSIVITVLPSAQDGTLRLNGNAVTANQEILASDLNKLSFTPENKTTTYTASFQFRVKDSGDTLSVSSYTYSLSVTATNDAPAAVADMASIAEDASSTSGNVLTNDKDLDIDDTKTVTGLAGGSLGQALTSSYGSLTLQGNGIYVYTLDNANSAVQALGVGQTLTETFTYTMKDRSGSTSTATLTITITGTNDAPVATTASLTVVTPVPENATDAENPGTTVSSLLVSPSGAPLATDVDATDTTPGIAVYGSSTTDGMIGQWQYQLNGSGTWVNFSPSISAATLLPSDAKVRFVANPNVDDAKESGTATLNYYVWDGHGTAGSTLNVADGNRGGSSAVSVNAISAAIIVAPRNDAPQLTQTTITLTERSGGGKGSIVLTSNANPASTTDNGKHLYLYDPDNTGDQVMYRLEALPTVGKLYKNNIEMDVGGLFTQDDLANGRIKYAYIGGELIADTTDSFRVSIRDGAGGVVGVDGASSDNPWKTITLNIADVNAQVSAGTVSFNTVEYVNSGDRVDLIGLKPTDADASGSPTGFPRMAVESLPLDGKLQYWNGSAYVDMGAAQLRGGGSTVWFTDADLTAHPLRYIPSSAEPSTYGGKTTFNVYVEDGGRQGNPGVATSGSATVTINVSPYNDQPAATTNTLTLNQRDANVTISGADGTGNISVSDPDSDASKRVYTISAAPVHGYLTLNGARIGVGAAFTQADLDGGKLKYTHDGTEPAVYGYTDRFDFTVTDGDGGQTNSSLTLHINNVNDAPIPVTHHAYTAGNASITIGSGILNATDADSPGSMRTYVVTSLPEGGVLKLNGIDLAVNQLFTQADIDAGLLTYVPNDPLANARTSFNFTVNDGETVNNTANGTIYINPTGGGSGGNPIAGNHSGLVAEGLFVQFTQSQIDGGTGSTLKLTDAPDHGKLFLNGVRINVNDTFTQADITAGKLVYVSDGTEPDSYGYAETFKIARADGSNETTITLTVTPVDDAPIIGQTSDSLGTIEESNTGAGDASSFSLAGVTNAVKVTTAQLSGSDVDTDNAQLYYVVENAPANGALRQWNGAAWVTLTAGSTFNVQDVAAGKIAYFHNPDSELRADSFKVYLIDGAVVQAGDVIIGNPIAESPTLTVSDGSTTIPLNKDAVMRSPSRTVNITITNVNDAPVAASTGFAVDEGTGETSTTRPTNPKSIQVLNTSILAVSDSDDDVRGFNNGVGQGYYEIVALTTKGWIQISDGTTWSDMAAGQRFAYSDITSGRLRYVHDGSESTADSFQYRAADPHAGGIGNTATVSINIRPVNDAPKVTGSLVIDGTTSVPEGGARRVTTEMLGVTLENTDPDNTANQVQYRITSIANLHGTLYLGDPVSGAPGKVLGVGSAITLQQILDGKLWYQHEGSDPDNYSRTATFGFQISDSSGMEEPTGTFTIKITPVNDAPVVTGLTGGATFTEGDTSTTPNAPAILIDSSVTLTDSDLANNNADFRGGSLTVGIGLVGDKSHDQLGIKSGGAIGYDSGTGIVTYNGVQIGMIALGSPTDGRDGHDLKISFTGANASLNLAAVKALIESITFAHTDYENAVTGTRTVTYTLVDGGGTDSYTDDRGRVFTGQDTWSGSATVKVVAANDRPVLTPHTGGALNLATIDEDVTNPSGIQVGSFIGSGADNAHTGITDVDAGAVPGIAITGLVNAASGKWQYLENGTTWKDVGSVSATGALLLRATDYLRFVPDQIDGGTATITYKAWDQTTGISYAKVDTTSNAQTSAFSVAVDTAQVTVTPVNDTPTLSGPNSVTATEDTLFSFTGTNKLTLGDVDSGSHLIKLTLTFTGSGSYQFSGSTPNIFTNDTGSATHTAWSGFTDGSTLTVYGTVANLNTMLAKLQYRPAADANDQNLGAQSVTSQPSVKLDVDDLGWGVKGDKTGSAGLTATKTVTISINPVNDTPDLQLSANTTQQIDEALDAGTAATRISAGLILSDARDSNNTGYGEVAITLTALHGNLSFTGYAGVTVVSGDGSRTLELRGTLVNLNAALAAGNSKLFYRPDVQFSGTETITAVLNDKGNVGSGGEKTATAMINLLVSGLNDAPSIVGLDTTSANTFAENGNAIVVDANMALSDPELSKYDNWGYAVLTIERNGGANANDVFSLTGSGNTGVNFSGSDIRIGTTAVATFTNTGGKLVITFNEGVKTTQVNQVVQAICYSNSNDNPPGSVDLLYRIDDGDTDNPDRTSNGQGGGGNKWSTAVIKINITATNDAPALDGLPNHSYSEDGGSIVLAPLADPADPELSYLDNWNRATLTIERNGSPNASDRFVASGTLGALTEGGSLVVDGVVVGTVTTNSNGTLVLTFVSDSGRVTTNQVRSVMRQIAYENNRQSLGATETESIKLNWKLEDGDTDPDRANGQGAGGNKSFTAQQTITVTGINDAPMLSDTSLTITQNEDDGAPKNAVGTQISALVGGITDVDEHNGNGIAIIGADSAHGTWYYTTDGGTSWRSFTATTGSALLLANDGNTRIYFQPSSNWHGSIAAGLTIRAWDRSIGTNGGTVDLSTGGATGGTTAFSTATDTVTLVVNPVNDQPTATTNVTLPSFTEDVTTPAGTVLSSLAFGYSDATDNQSAADGGDTSTSLSYIAIVGSTGYDAAQGSWQISIKANPDPAVPGDWITIPASGLSTTNALIFSADRQIRFVPAANFHGTPGTLSMHLADGSANLSASVSNSASAYRNITQPAYGGTGDTGAWTSASRTIGTIVTPVNDAPNLSGSLALPSTQEDTTSLGYSAGYIAGWLSYNDNVDNSSAISGGGNASTSKTAIAIVGNAATASQGGWEYTLDGTTWTTIPTNVANGAAIVLSLSDANHQVRFVPAADYYGTPGGLTVRAADGTWNGMTGVMNISAAVGGTNSWSSSTAAVGIAVSAVNDAPQIKELDAVSSSTFHEGVDTASDREVLGTPVVLDATVEIVDTEIVTQRVDSFDGATLTIARDNGSGGFSASGQDVFGLNSAAVSVAGSVISIGGTAVADITSNGNGQLVITFRATANGGHVNTIAGAITYANSSDTPPDHVDLRYRFNDDNRASAQGSGGSLTGDATIRVNIVAANDPPLAVDDIAAITEDTATVTGDVINGAGRDSDPEGDTLTVVALRTGNESGSGTAGTVGQLLAGAYGSLTLNANGSYSYALNNDNAAVNKLKNGETLTEIYTYTISDGHGGTDVAQLTITIHGRTDGTPALTANDGNGSASGHAEVFEKGLTDSGDNSETAAGTLTVTATDGLASVTVGGTVVTLAQLRALGTTPIVIDTGEGKLTLTGFVEAENVGGIPVAGTIHYSYTLKAALNQTGLTESTDDIALIVTDQGNGTSNGTLTVRIVDDTPVANADSGSITEDATPGTVSGNVMSNDRAGADSPARVTDIAFNGVSVAVGTTISTTYGSIVIAADGSYTYTLDNSNPAVNALDSSSSPLIDSISYTLTDGDGDTSSAVLTIRISGANDAPVLADTVRGIVQLEDAAMPSGTAGTAVADIIGIAGSSDADAGALVRGIAIVGADNSKGNWYYTIDGGSNWQLLGSVSNGSALLLGPAARLYFVPSPNANTSDGPTGTSAPIANGLQFRAWDRSTGTEGEMADTSTNGGTTPYSTFIDNVQLTITPVNDGPAIRNLDAVSVNASPANPYVPGAGGVVIDPDVSFEDRELGTERDNWNGASLSIVRNGGASADDLFSAKSGGPLTLSGGNAIVNGITIGSYTNTAGTLTLTFNGNATTALVNAAARNIAYSNAQATPSYSSVTLTWSLNDQNVNTTGGGIGGGGQDQGNGGRQQVSADIVLSLNQPPVAVADSAIAVEAGGIHNGIVGINPSGNVLANDIDPDIFDTKTVTTAGTYTGTYGTLTIAADGTYTYVLDNNLPQVDRLRNASDTLSDTFTYTLRDAAGLTSTATLTITIEGRNDTPIAVNDTAVAVETGGLNNGTAGSNPSGNVLSNDTDVDTGDTKTVTTTGKFAGQFGELTLNADGSYSYVVDNGNAGVQALRIRGDTLTDTFTYTMTDAAGATSTATLTITIEGRNDTPVAVNDAATAVEAGGLNNGTVGSNPSGNVLTNDTDVDGGDSKAVTTTGKFVGQFGELTLNGDGSYIYVVDNGNASVQALRTSGDTLTDTFTYTMTDAAGSTSTATLTVTMEGRNDTPMAVNDTATAVEAGGLNNGTVGSNPSGNVLDNDTDVDSGDTKTVTTTGNLAGAYGTLTLNADGSYSYVVDNGNAAVQALRTSGDKLTDTFTYTMTDAAGATSTATLTITIEGRNDTPVAVNDTATAVEAGGLNNGTAGSNPSGNVLTNDTDVDSGDTKTVTTTGNLAGAYGTLTLNADGSYSYVVDNGNAAVQALRTSGDKLTDTFTYTMTDAAGATSTATLTVTMEGRNDTPMAVNDTATAVEAGGLNNGTVGSNPSGNVLDNDTDVDSGDTKTVTTTGKFAGQFGELTLNADGSYSYVVDNGNAAVQTLRTSGDTLTDTFTYTMTDAAGATSTATLTITIEGANDTPVAVNDTATAVEAGGLNNGTAGSNPSGNVLDNDTDVDAGDTKTVTTTGNLTGTFGTLTLNADGSYSYVVDNGNAAVQALRTSGDKLTDTFTYTMTDAAGATSIATLTVTMEGRNDTPMAVNDTATAVEAGGLNNGTVGSNPSGNVLDNDTDVDSGDTKTVTTTGKFVGQFGELTLNADGSYSYVVDNGNAAVQALRTSGNKLTDIFTYTMTDAAGATSTATLTVTIEGRNDNPIAVNDTAVAVEAGGMLNGTPGSDAVGNVLDNDTDVDAGDSKTVTTTGKFEGQFGELTLNADGSYRYVVNNEHPLVDRLRAGESLSETFTYTMTDAAGTSSTATLTITLRGVDDVYIDPPKPVIPPAPVTPEVPPATPATVPPAPNSGGGSEGSGRSDSGVGFFTAPGDIMGEGAGRKLDLRMTSEPAAAASSQAANSESRKLESTDRGFPVERLKAEAGTGAQVDGQQKGGDKLFVFKGISNTAVLGGSSLDYRVERQAFGHTDPAAIVQLEATLTDGNPLPEWMEFDPTSGTFSGRPPKDATANIEVKVTARDNDGREASTTFRLEVDPSQPRGELPATDKQAKRSAQDGVKRGSLPFSEQLKQARRGESTLDRLLGSLGKDKGKALAKTASLEKLSA